MDFNPIIMPLCGPTCKLKPCKISTQVEIASWARVWQHADIILERSLMGGTDKVGADRLRSQVGGGWVGGWWVGGWVVGCSNVILDPTLALIRAELGFGIQVEAECGKNY